MSLWRFRQIDLYNTICSGINLRDKKDLTMMQDTVSQVECNVNVVEGNEGKLETATSVVVHETVCVLC